MYIINPNEKLLYLKTTLNGRRPKNIKSGISQQVVITSSSNCKLKILAPTQDLNVNNPKLKTT